MILWNNYCQNCLISCIKRRIDTTWPRGWFGGGGNLSHISHTSKSVSSKIWLRPSKIWNALQIRSIVCEENFRAFRIRSSGEEEEGWSWNGEASQWAFWGRFEGCFALRFGPSKCSYSFNFNCERSFWKTFSIKWLYQDGMGSAPCGRVSILRPYTRVRVLLPMLWSLVAMYPRFTTANIFQIWQE